jgi:hypothetical protein
MKRRSKIKENENDWKKGIIWRKEEKSKAEEENYKLRQEKKKTGKGWYRKHGNMEGWREKGQGRMENNVAMCDGGVFSAWTRLPALQSRRRSWRITRRSAQEKSWLFTSSALY